MLSLAKRGSSWGGTGNTHLGSLAARWLWQQVLFFKLRLDQSSKWHQKLGTRFVTLIHISLWINRPTLDVFQGCAGSITAKSKLRRSCNEHYSQANQKTSQRLTCTKTLFNSIIATFFPKHKYFPY